MHQSENSYIMRILLQYFRYAIFVSETRRQHLNCELNELNHR